VYALCQGRDVEPLFRLIYRCSTPIQQYHLSGVAHITPLVAIYQYTGGMPTLGCPGCNGDTMAYVAQEPSSAHRALGSYAEARCEALPRGMLREVLSLSYRRSIWLSQASLVDYLPVW
jgi:hypothetical protein